MFRYLLPILLTVFGWTLWSCSGKQQPPSVSLSMDSTANAAAQSQPTAPVPAQPQPSAAMSQERADLIECYAEVDKWQTQTENDACNGIHEQIMEVLNEQETALALGPYSPIMASSPYRKVNGGDYWLLETEYATPRANYTVVFSMHKKSGMVADALVVSDASQGQDGSSYQVSPVKMTWERYELKAETRNAAGKLSKSEQWVYAFDGDTGKFTKQ